MHALRRADVRARLPRRRDQGGKDGVVRSALKPRCIACSNCVLACPFGIPTVHVGPELMMKCDMCYDRTSVGLRPMCATVCPSQALTFGPPEVIARQRARTPVRDFRFGNEHVKTKVFMMPPVGEPAIVIDVEDYMWKETDAAE
jgi:Fe-S-cluster-containing dehydrogenase component